MQQISVQSEKLFQAVYQIQEFQKSVKTTLKQIDVLRYFSLSFLLYIDIISMKLMTNMFCLLYESQR